MKSFGLLVLVLFAVSSASAKIENSALESRHQDLIEKAIESKCQFVPGSLVEIATQVTPVRVDQGIMDYKYETVLQFKVRVDQMLFDIYEVTVRSAFAAAYDHVSQEWGIYDIESVSTCNQL